MPKTQDIIEATPEVLNRAVEVTQSVVNVGEQLGVAKGALKVAGSITDAITPFLPLISSATSIIGEMMIIYKQAECNENIVGALYYRTKQAEFAIETLRRRKKIQNEVNGQSWYKAFNRFVYVLSEIRNFAKKVASTHGFKKYFESYSIKDKFEQLTNDYDLVMKELNFTMVIANEEQRRYDSECIREDIGEMSSYIQNIKSATAQSAHQINELLEEVRLLRDCIESGKGLDAKPNQIDENDIKDPFVTDRTDYRGSNNHIIRKQYKTTIEIACKPFKLNKEVQGINENQGNYKRQQGQLAILSKLSDCTNILKFYGLTKLNGEDCMILEWAHYGNLREVYENYDIPWMRKLHIAIDLCRAIAFLDYVKILHHDLRCENVMLTKNLEPKLTNFDYARSTDAESKKIPDLEIVHWLAPEKIENNSYRYDIKCEIFSFGMLLWELTFEKIPYQGWDVERVEAHVIAGKRERITFGPVENDRELEIQNKLGEVITNAWKERLDRINLPKLFNTLEELQSKYKYFMEQDCNSNLLPQKTLDLDGSSTPPPPLESDADMLLPELDELSIDFDDISPALSLEEGIKAHTKQNYDVAWECFEFHAKNGNAYAIYWKGYYLWEGKFVEKNHNEAIKLFKEAADKAIPDAQLRYAFALKTLKGNVRIKEDKNFKEFFKYLTLAADGGNTVARYTLGDCYFNKKLGLDNKQKGIHYLRLAAIKNNNKAMDLLKNHNISITDGPKLED
ncbi:17534_t:CDS:2 [Funneliformis geosporum]|uniref:3890_t:CDS:1 n=1 Tax=Funneliformis geosporum TaxID=1117311 RepID=A0A9W4SIJ3_9GLOM|nr:17534_t:CDS:2 [Funneliformis geosporum]CAI2168292.1 3890_t:CDS:2 [Funneliformis geosporum]